MAVILISFAHQISELVSGRLGSIGYMPTGRHKSTTSLSAQLSINCHEVKLHVGLGAVQPARKNLNRYMLGMLGVMDRTPLLFAGFERIQAERFADWALLKFVTISVVRRCRSERSAMILS
jgi:hypothetical protein